MTLADYHAAISPKVKATHNLHNLFSKSTLDFFIMLSSLAGIIGYPSQSNYSAGGSYLDALARKRVAQGLPAVSIDLGAVKAIGYVAESVGVSQRMQKVGHRPLREDQVLGVIESAILHPYDPQILIGFNTGPGLHWDRNGESQLGRDARFTALQYRPPRNQNAGGGAKDTRNINSLGSKLAEAASLDEAEQLIGRAIAQKMTTIFMVPIEDIDLAKNPGHYGVDSLVAVDLRNMLAHNAGADVSIFDILQSPSLTALASKAAAKSSLVG